MAEKNAYTHSQESQVDGLTVVARESVATTAFGESGDVFNHTLWRTILFVLWSFDETRGKLFGLLSDVLLKAKSLKVLDKNKVAVYNLPLPPPADKRREGLEAIIGTGINFPLKLNFPTEASKVKANSLTMERLKCVGRIFMVPKMLQINRFPATAESIGLGNLIRSLVLYENSHVADDKAVGEQKEWVNIKTACGPIVKGWVNARSAAAGTISTKEIYVVDEENFPGCIAWAGAMALMTDAANKLRAPSQPKDTQYQFEKSAFYPDFKRKMLAKNVRIPQSNEYLIFLNNMTAMMSKYLKTATGMTAEESGILDRLMADAKGQEANEVKALTAQIGVFTSNTPADLDKELANVIAAELEKLTPDADT